MKTTLLLIIVSTVILTCKVQAQTTSVWTAEYQTKTYYDMDTAVKATVPDDSVRKLLITYVIERFKKILPKGLESISTDSLTSLSMNLGKEWAMANPGLLGGIAPVPTKWTPGVEQIFRESLLKEWAKDDLPRGNKFCDCAIKKLKKIYPDAVIMPPPKDVIKKVASECISEIDK